jgi:hypothetical protein
MNRLSRILVPAATAATLVLSIPAVASATDYCVGTSCGGTDVNTLEEALTDAGKDSDADRVFLGEGTYQSVSSFGFMYKAGGPVEIIGAGSGKTLLTAPLGAPGVLTLEGGGGTSVHDLAIQLPRYATGYGLWTQNAALRIDVGEATEQSHGRTGVVLTGGKLEDSEARLAREPNAMAVEFSYGGGTLRRSVVSAGTGVLSRYGGSTIEQSFVTGSDFALRALANVTTIRSTRVHTIGDHSTGIRADTKTASTTVNADGVTVTGTPLPDVVGVSATNAIAPDQSAHVKLTNSVVRMAGRSLVAESAPLGAGDATVAASYSDYDPSFDMANGTHAHITETNVSNVGDAGFVGNSDFHLLPASKLVDAGDPNAADGADFDGKPLVADGDGDGVARRDIGAYELSAIAPGGGGGTGATDTTAPVVSRVRATRARLRYTLSEPARVTIAIKRVVKRGGHVRLRAVASLKRPGRQGANAIRLRGRRTLRAGRYRAVISATDVAGNHSKPRSVRLRIARMA